MRPSLGLSLLAVVALGLPPHEARGEDSVLLAEVLPALEGTSIGALDLGPAPPPGQIRTVRGSEIRAALRAAGVSSEGLSIPARARISRAPRVLDEGSMRALVTPSLTESLVPCVVGDVAVPSRTTVVDGPLDVFVERASAPARGGRTSAVVRLSRGGFEKRIVLSVAVTCPPPAVSPGDAVTIRARAGNVVASVPGTALQPGREGDVVRVTNRRSGTSRDARVIGPGLVEVIQ